MKQKQPKKLKKPSGRAIMIGAAAIAVSQLLLYLGTRTLEVELERVFVHPYRKD